jgi:hypothetical protein
MSYADVDFYKNTFFGIETDDNIIEKFLIRASDIIDLYTNYTIDIDKLTEKQLVILKRANCVQAEMFIRKNDTELDYNSMSLGSFSISNSSKNDKKIVIDSLTKHYLFCAGINLSQGIVVCV